MISSNELNELYENLYPIMNKVASKLLKNESIKIEFPVGSITFEVKWPIDIEEDNNYDD